MRGSLGGGGCCCRRKWEGRLELVTKLDSLEPPLVLLGKVECEVLEDCEKPNGNEEVEEAGRPLLIDEPFVVTDQAPTVDEDGGKFEPVLPPAVSRPRSLSRGPSDESSFLISCLAKTSISLT